MGSNFAKACVATAVLREVFCETVLQPSPGCDESKGLVPYGDGVTWNVITSASVERKYLADIPSMAAQGNTNPVPMIFSYHGQGGNAGDQRGYRFDEIGKEKGFITVYPQGLDDHGSRPDEGTGWNVGTGGDNSTCVEGFTGGSCYSSCLAQPGQCGPCNWSTCHDDVQFFKDMLDSIANALCIDMNRIYIHGMSNGGMLTHYLTQQLPDVFAAVAPMDALPLFGHGDYPAALNQVAYLQLYDRRDSVIPAGGGNSTGWIYVSLDHVQAEWANIHECATEASSVATDFDGGTTQNAFMEYKSCKTGRRVMRCLYDGVHASSPRSISGKDITADMVTWFFLQFSRGATVHASASGGLSLTNHTNISIDSVAQPVVPEYGHLRR